MKIVTPIAVTSSMLTASNVPITETAWTAGTYTTGTQRYVGTTLYEVIASPNTADNPTIGVNATPPTWKSLGAINRFKMFDDIINTQTTRSGTIEVTVDPGQLVNAVSFFGLVGNTITLTLDDPVEGEVFTETKSLQDNSLIVDWYAYFFEGIYFSSDAVFLGLPSYTNAVMTAIIDAGPINASCGEMVIGKQSTLGISNYGTSVSIQDYSIKSTDEFGNIIIQPRAFSKRGDYDVTVETSRISAIQKLLADIRTTPAVFIGEEDKPETVIYGFYKSFNIVISTPSISECSIEVEGLV